MEGQFARSPATWTALPRTTALVWSPDQRLWGRELLAALTTGGLNSEFGQNDHSHCLHYSSGITSEATGSFKTTTSDAWWIKTWYRSNPDFIQEEIKRVGKIKTLTALQPGIKLALTATAETVFPPMQIHNIFLLFLIWSHLLGPWQTQADTAWWQGTDIRTGLVLLLQSIHSLQAGEQSCEWTEAFPQWVLAY